VSPEIVSALIPIAATFGGYVLRVLQERLKQYLQSRKYAFRLWPGVGRSWLLRPLHRGKFTVTHELAWDSAGNEKPVDAFLVGQVIDNANAGWRIGVDLEPGDTYEIHWEERAKEYSTSVRIYEEDRKYLLRRENTGH